MPFGMCNAPATFQRAMNKLFKDLIGVCVTVYIDDIQVYTKTFEDHVERVKQVLERLRKNGLFLKPKKCTIAANEMKYLGFVLKEGGLSTDESKVLAITTYPRPENVSEIRAFLGLAMYYRRFMKGFARIAAPMNELLRKDRIFNWTIEQEVAFRALKQRLTSAPVLVRPDWNKRFYLFTDASSIGLGAILFQQDDQGRERVICYASSGTRGAEQNYGATKLECLAVIWAIDKFRWYLLGAEFTIVTDHSALQWLIFKKEPRGIFAR